MDYILTNVFDLLKFRRAKPVSQSFEKCSSGSAQTRKCSVFVVSTHSRLSCTVWSGSSVLSTKHTHTDVPFLSKLTGRQLTQNLETNYKGLRQTELISSTRTFSTNVCYESGVRAGRASFFPVLGSRDNGQAGIQD